MSSLGGGGTRRASSVCSEMIRQVFFLSNIDMFWVQSVILICQPSIVAMILVPMTKYFKIKRIYTL